MFWHRGAAVKTKFVDPAKGCNAPVGAGTQHPLKQVWGGEQHVPPQDVCPAGHSPTAHLVVRGTLHFTVPSGWVQHNSPWGFITHDAGTISPANWESLPTTSDSPQDASTSPPEAQLS